MCGLAGVYRLGQVILQCLFENVIGDTYRDRDYHSGASFRQSEAVLVS